MSPHLCDNSYQSQDLWKTTQCNFEMTSSSCTHIVVDDWPFDEVPEENRIQMKIQKDVPLDDALEQENSTFPVKTRSNCSSAAHFQNSKRPKKAKSTHTNNNRKHTIGDEGLQFLHLQPERRKNCSFWSLEEYEPAIESFLNGLQKRNGKGTKNPSKNQASKVSPVQGSYMRRNKTAHLKGQSSKSDKHTLLDGDGSSLSSDLIIIDENSTADTHPSLDDTESVEFPDLKPKGRETTRKPRSNHSSKAYPVQASRTCRVKIAPSKHQNTNSDGGSGNKHNLNDRDDPTFSDDSTCSSECSGIDENSTAITQPSHASIDDSEFFKFPEAKFEELLIEACKDSSTPFCGCSDCWGGTESWVAFKNVFQQDSSSKDSQYDSSKPAIKNRALECEVLEENDLKWWPGAECFDASLQQTYGNDEEWKHSLSQWMPTSNAQSISSQSSGQYHLHCDIFEGMSLGDSDPSSLPEAEGFEVEIGDAGELQSSNPQYVRESRTETGRPGPSRLQQALHNGISSVKTSFRTFFSVLQSRSHTSSDSATASVTQSGSDDESEVRGLDFLSVSVV